MEWRRIDEFPQYEINREGVVRHVTTGRVRRPQFNGQAYLSFNKEGKNYSRTIRALLRRTWPEYEEVKRQRQSRILVQPHPEPRDERFYKINQYPDYAINRRGEVMNLKTKHILEHGKRGELAVHLKDTEGKMHYISVRRLMSWTFGQI